MNYNTDNKFSIRAERLTVNYDKLVALDIPELETSGNCVAIVGHNGAGKSTLIKTILNLLPTNSGKIQLFDSSTDTALLAERDMAFCPETGAVFADISVESYVKFWCRIKHGDSRYYRKAGSKYIELLEIAPLLGKLGRELSKGQCRRVQTAIGFITQPRLFLFDEPFDGLDVLKTNELAHIILAESDQMNFIISSHRMDVIERLADIVIVLKHGLVVAAGSVEEVCSKLSGNSTILSNLKNRVAVLAALKKKLPDNLINHLGEIISITGHSNDEKEVRTALEQLGETEVSISNTRPSLTDAVNYHLKSLNMAEAVQ